MEAHPIQLRQTDHHKPRPSTMKIASNKKTKLKVRLIRLQQMPHHNLPLLSIKVKSNPTKTMELRMVRAQQTSLRNPHLRLNLPSTLHLSQDPPFPSHPIKNHGGVYSVKNETAAREVAVYSKLSSGSRSCFAKDRLPSWWGNTAHNAGWNP